MALIADDMQCHGHCYFNGKAAFPSFVQAWIERGGHIEISDLRESGDTVVFNYLVSNAGNETAIGTDSVMQIKNGQIIYFEIK